MRYVALETVFVNDCIVEKGETFESEQDLGPAAVRARDYKPDPEGEPEVDPDSVVPNTFHGIQSRRGRPLGSKNKPK